MDRPREVDRGGGGGGGGGARGGAPPSSAGLGGPGEGPGQVPSYASIIRNKEQERLDLNIINVKIKRDFHHRETAFSDTICQRVCELININPKTDTKGCQYLYDKGGITVAIWLKDHIQVRSSEEHIAVVPGFDITSVHPASRQQVPLMIMGLEQDVPDQAVIEYIKLFGIKPCPWGAVEGSS